MDNPASSLWKWALVGIVVTAAMYFIGGDVFDVFSTILGPWMILSGVAIWLWFVSGESFKASVGNFFKKVWVITKKIWISLKKNYYNYRALQKKNDLLFRKK